MRRFILGILKRISNALFGADITHRSPLASTILKSIENLVNGIDPRVRARRRFEKEFPNAPWWSMNSIAPIEKILRPEFTGFEFGAGRSSIWLANRIAKLTSLETSAYWHEKTLVAANDAGLADKLEIILLPIESDFAATPAQKNAYINKLDDFPKESFDFILVDGLLRPESFEKSFSSVKPGGYIILDNADRDDMVAGTQAKREELLAWYDDGVWATAVYQKP